MVRRLLIVLVACLASAASTFAGASAQAERECALPPVELPLFSATPAATVAASPVSEPASAEPDQAEIDQAVADIFACINTGIPAFTYAVFTERYLADKIIDDDAYQPALEQSIETGIPAEPSAFVVEEVSAVTALDDGRVEVTVRYAEGATTYTDTLVLAQVDGRWLIDDVTAMEPAP